MGGVGSGLKKKPETISRQCQMVRLYDSGMTFKEVGLVFNVSKQAVHQHISHIVTTEKGHIARSIEFALEVAPMKPKEIAEQVGTTLRSVHCCLYRNKNKLFKQVSYGIWGLVHPNCIEVKE